MQLLACFVADWTVSRQAGLFQNGLDSLKAVTDLEPVRPKDAEIFCLFFNRPTVTELLKHPFFKKAKGNDFLIQTIIEKGPSLASRTKKVGGNF